MQKNTPRIRKHPRSWLIGAGLALGLFLTATALLAPLAVNLDSIRQAVEKRVSEQTGGQITLGRLALGYLPHPYVAISNARLDIPGSFTVSIGWIKIYPRLWALAQGDFKPALIKLEDADYSLALPRIEQGEGEIDKIQSAEKIAKAIISAVRGLPEFKLPLLKIRIKSGKIQLTTPTGRRFVLSRLQARYNHRPSGVDFSITCQSNLWKQINIRGSLNPKDFTGRGSIRMSRFHPQGLVAYLFPGLPHQVTSIGTNVNIDFEAAGPGRLTAVVDGGINRLELKAEGRKLIVSGVRLKASVQFGPRSAHIKLHALRIDHPRLALKAGLFYSGAQKGIQLSIDASGIDVAAVRQAALTLAGRSEMLVDVFNVVRAGQVPWMTVRSHGKTFAELGRLDRLVIRGRMNRGRIFIPEIELDLADVFGDATIAGGVLLGSNLAARMGKTRGKNGRMKLGLDEIAKPFELNIAIDADLSQLPPVLMRIVDDAAFEHELSLIKDVRGSATGTLGLGDDIDDLTATVNVSRARFTAVYQRIAFPVQIDGGRFFYSGTHLEFEKFNATVGRSRLSALAATVNWKHTPVLSADVQTARIDLPQLFSWLLSFEELKRRLASVHSLSGSAIMNDLNIQGPFFRPLEWNIKTRGSVDQLVVKSSRLPEPLQVVSGHFRWREKQLDCSGVTASMGKSKILLDRASIDWQPQPPRLKIEAAAGEVNAAEFYPWLSALEDFPVLFRDMAAEGTVAFDNLHLDGPLAKPRAWQYEGVAVIKGLKVHSSLLGDRLNLNNGVADIRRRVSAGGGQLRINIDTLNMDWGRSRLVMAGEIASADTGVTLDLGVTADRLDWEQVKRLIDAIGKKRAGGRTGAVQVTGKTIVRVARFDYRTYRVQPLVTRLSFHSGQVNIDVHKASLCGLSFRGQVTVNENMVAIHLLPSAADQQLGSTLACISGKTNPATGIYDLSGLLISKSRPAEILDALGGRVVFSARQGRIYRFGLLAKILALLNVTEIYRGQVPDLIGKGFGYRSITASADIRNGIVKLKEFVIDGTSMGIACKGTIDLPENKIKLTVLVAPFRTADSIVSTIPLIGHIMGGKLISIPFQASGDLKNPQVYPLPPTAVGAGVLGILERTLKLPITIIEPVLPKYGKKPQLQPAH